MSSAPRNSRVGRVIGLATDRAGAVRSRAPSSDSSGIGWIVSGPWPAERSRHEKARQIIQLARFEPGLEGPGEIDLDLCRGSIFDLALTEHPKEPAELERGVITDHRGIGGFSELHRLFVGGLDV